MTAPKRHLGQEKPIEEFVIPPPLSSKRQKLSKTVPYQSIEQLNDAAIISGINLMEEEEQLFSRPKEGSQVSKSSQRVLQQEEEILAFQNIPLQGKLAQIMSKCGIKSIGKDVELCLSMSVKERMDGLISNLIRMSKQRVDFEKRKHQILVTSDVQHQIVVMNPRVQDRAKQHAEESRGEILIGGDMDKDANCSGTPKVKKANRMVDEILLTAAANAAARAAVGGDDLTAKWQFMGKKAGQKHDTAFRAQPSEKMIYMLSHTSGGQIGDHQESQEKGTENRSQGDQFVMPREKVLRHISVKDVIAVLEREPQLSKSTFIHGLHERLNANAAATKQRLETATLMCL